MRLYIYEAIALVLACIILGYDPSILNNNVNNNSYSAEQSWA